MQIKLKNTLTGKYYGKGTWNCNLYTAEVIDDTSPEFNLLKYTWTMEHVECCPLNDDHMTEEEVKEQLADYLSLLESIETVEEARQYLRGEKDDRWEGEYLGRALLEVGVCSNMYIPTALANGVKLSYIDHFRLSLLNWVLEDMGEPLLPVLKIN